MGQISRCSSSAKRFLLDRKPRAAQLRRSRTIAGDLTRFAELRPLRAGGCQAVLSTSSTEKGEAPAEPTVPDTLPTQSQPRQGAIGQAGKHHDEPEYEDVPLGLNPEDNQKALNTTEDEGPEQRPQERDAATG